MTREKRISLEKYVVEMTGKLNAPVPEKHKNNPTTYMNFVKRELSQTIRKLEEEKLLGGK